MEPIAYAWKHNCMYTFQAQLVTSRLVADTLESTLPLINVRKVPISSSPLIKRLRYPDKPAMSDSKEYILLHFLWFFFFFNFTISDNCARSMGFTYTVGDSIYMCYIYSRDFENLFERLKGSCMLCGYICDIMVQ